MNHAENSPDRPLDVWFVCNAWTGGGAERVASTIVQHLDRDIVQPSVCLLRNDMSYPLPEDVEVYHLEYRGLPTFFPAARRLRRLVNDRRPDVVVSTVNANALLTGAALRRSAHRPPWIARIGNSPERHDSYWRRNAGRVVYPRVDQFVVNAKALAGEVTRCYGVPVDRITAIANPIDIGQIDDLASKTPSRRRSSEGHLLMAVGRLYRQKRYDVMLEALAILLKNIQVRLWVCGEGPLRKQLARHACRLNVDDAVDWLGFCDDPFALMRQADVFVMTSDHEGLPNALIEAQVLGIPAVSTDCPTGPAEIVEDGSTGILVPPGNVEAIANAMLELLGDEETRRRMAAAARARARSLFEHRKIIDAWQGLLVQSSAIHGDAA